MGNIFAGSEIVEIGIQIEKNGKDFYEELVNKSTSDKAKEIFQLLAGEEEKHIAAFRGILSSVQQYEPKEAYPGEYFAYMNALASGYVFTKEGKGKEMAGQAGSDADAIDLGIKLEKDSIVFYEGMKKVVPEKDHALLEQLIKQEQEHLVKLVSLKEEM